MCFCLAKHPLIAKGEIEKGGRACRGQSISENTIVNDSYVDWLILIFLLRAFFALILKENLHKMCKNE